MYSMSARIYNYRLVRIFNLGQFVKENGTIPLYSVVLTFTQAKGQSSSDEEVIT